MENFILNKMTITTKTIAIVLAGVWIIFSVVYIAWDRWDRFKNGQMTQAYNLGKTDTINAAISQAKNTKCEPFSIFDKNQNKNVEVINTKCLQSAPVSAPEK